MAINTNKINARRRFSLSACQIRTIVGNVFNKDFLLVKGFKRFIHKIT